MDAATRELVISRARDRCEYCLLPQSAAPVFTFHIEHVHAQQHVIDDSPGNLAFARPDCNRHKGPNLTTLADNTRRIIPLFHPRQDRWEDHFEYQGPLIVGRTEIGTATAKLLQMNSAERLEMRAELIQAGNL